MAQTRYMCSLTTADEPACQSYARVTIVDSEGARARGCPRHAVAALDGIAGAHVDWADSKGLNQWEWKALELSELRCGISTVEDHQGDEHEHRAGSVTVSATQTSSL